jgi:hypothetical protein
LTTVGILLCAGWLPHFRLFVWGYLCLVSGMVLLRHIVCTRIPHRSPASIFVQQQMISIFGYALFFKLTIGISLLLWERPPVRSPTGMLPFPEQWR